MRGKLLSVLILTLVLLASCAQRDQNNVSAEPQGSPPPGSQELPPVIPPSVAGAFYPSNAETLRADIERYLKSAKPSEVNGEIIAAIVPHAGYIYSAPVAAYAYEAIAKQNTGGAKKPDAIIVVAFSHRGGSSGVSVYYKGAMETPLGKKSVNEKIAREFMDSDPRLSFSQRVFAGEHSAEVQLPFIQTILPDVPIVPVLFGEPSMANIEAVAKGLERISHKNHILVIGTTDLSHYNPYEVANTLDAETVKLMVEGNSGKMAQYLTAHYDRLCGVGPVLAVMSYAESQGATPVLLKYANSGDTAGDKRAVVGYAAVVFVKKNKSESKSLTTTPAQSATKSGDSYSLSDEDKKTLLRLARGSLESFVRDKKILQVEPPASERLKQDGAAFVTLTKNGYLRGCIGTMEAMMPLYQTVIRMAVEAASEDPRFRPVQPDELKDIHIEISVNTPLRPVASADEIILGKHGVVVARGMRRGVFLPQVATETGWSKEEFLEHLCTQKAGLPPDAYKKDAKLYVFESIIFEENK